MKALRVGFDSRGSGIRVRFRAQGVGIGLKGRLGLGLVGYGLARVILEHTKDRSRRCHNMFHVGSKV